MQVWICSCGEIFLSWMTVRTRNRKAHQRRSASGREGNGQLERPGAPTSWEVELDECTNHAEIREKREALKRHSTVNHIEQKSAAVLLYIKPICALISDVTAGVLPLTADGEHLLWHHWFSCGQKCNMLQTHRRQHSGCFCPYIIQCWITL